MHDIPFAGTQPWAIDFSVVAITVFGEIKSRINNSRL
jgi:hypothetical protein